MIGRPAAMLLALALAGCALACGGSSPDPTPTPTATATVTPSPTRTATPTATATPDPLARQPKTAAEALASLKDHVERGAPPGCDPLFERWDAACLEGDLDDDGAEDVVYLVPLDGGAGNSPEPGVVLLVRAARQVERFPQRDDADMSELGKSLFEIADRDGEGAPEFAYLSTRCGASNCVSRLEVQSWDGTAWRDIGPGQPGFDNPRSITWSGEGAESVLEVTSGVLGSVGAGPTRAVTATYTLRDGVYQLEREEPEEPTYLFHAVVDADALFDEGKFAEAITAYQSAIGDETLADWHAETGRPPGRPALEGYALFRIAVATAALGQDPTNATDAVIIGSEEPLFSEGIVAFRRGYHEGGNVSRGCTDATRYFTQPASEAILGQRFDYGYGNPRKGPLDICPL